MRHSRLVPTSTYVTHRSYIVFAWRAPGVRSVHTVLTFDGVCKRVKLAAMAQYRKGLVLEGAGRNRARYANLCLFRAIYPLHAAIERPDDKATNPAGYDRLSKSVRFRYRMNRSPFVRRHEAKGSQADILRGNLTSPSMNFAILAAR